MCMCSGNNRTSQNCGFVDNKSSSGIDSTPHWCTFSAMARGTGTYAYRGCVSSHDAHVPIDLEGVSLSVDPTQSNDFSTKRILSCSREGMHFCYNNCRRLATIDAAPSKKQKKVTSTTTQKNDWAILSWLLLSRHCAPR